MSSSKSHLSRANSYEVMQVSTAGSCSCESCDSFATTPLETSFIPNKCITVKLNNKAPSTNIPTCTMTPVCLSEPSTQNSSYQASIVVSAKHTEKQCTLPNTLETKSLKMITQISSRTRFNSSGNTTKKINVVKLADWVVNDLWKDAFELYALQNPQAEYQENCSFYTEENKRIKISFSSYVKRLKELTDCSDNCFLLALLLFDRLNKKKRLYYTRLNVHKLMAVSLWISVKFYEDITFTDAHYAEKIAGIPLKDIEIYPFCESRLIDNGVQRSPRLNLLPSYFPLSHPSSTTAASVIDSGFPLQ